MENTQPIEVPSIQAIRDARERLGDRVVTTPVWAWRGREISDLLGKMTEVHLKLELFQHGGTFKPRGALLNMLSMDAEALTRGVTAVSAGNHAIAVAYAARTVGTTAKVVMPRSANPARVATCEAYGTEVVLVDDVHQAFDEVHRIEREEGRMFVHPFEGENVALGTGGVGLELCEQVPGLDAVIVPIGGGGLCAGISTAVKQMNPQCKVFGVEPEGADTMHRSFAAGSPQAIDKVRTIADSLGAPHAAPYSFEALPPLRRRAGDGRRRRLAPGHGPAFPRRQDRRGAGRRRSHGRSGRSVAGSAWRGARSVLSSVVATSI